MPTILGVGVFAALGLILQHRTTAPDWGPLNPIGAIVVFTSFVCAAYGPLLIPLAAYVTLLSQRRRLVGTLACWAVLSLAIGAAALGYSWALDAVELP